MSSVADGAGVPGLVKDAARRFAVAAAPPPPFCLPGTGLRRHDAGVLVRGVLMRGVPLREGSTKVPDPAERDAAVTPSYRFRTSLFARELTWTLNGDAIESSAGDRVPFADIASVRLSAFPGLRSYGQTVAPTGQQCRIVPRHGRRIVLNSIHYLGFGSTEDRAAEFVPFTDSLLRQVAAANPQALLLRGMPPLLRWVWYAVLLLTVLVGLLAAAILVVAVRPGGGFSLETLFIVPLAVGLVVSAVSIVRLLRRSRTQRLHLQ